MKRFRHFLLSITALSFGIARAQQAGTPVCPRDDAGFAAMQKKVEAKDAMAETQLASCYDLGMHVQPNGRESIRLLTEAAKQGYVPAEYELGRIYLYGRGVPADYSQALIWERKAAEQGDSRAQRDLAFMYERGFGVPADPAQAAEWNRKAAAHHEPVAQLHLGQALETGTGVPKDEQKAMEWYRRAALQNEPEAQLRLAEKLAQIPGTCAPALQWFEKAAENGKLKAMHEMGQLYLTKPCGVDRVNAFLWFSIGARYGSEESRREAEKLAVVIRPAQKKRAELKAERWVRNHPGRKEEEDEEEKR